MAKSDPVAYRVRFVVYDVLDMVVDPPPAAREPDILAVAIRQAERDHPLVAWQVDEETVEVIRLRTPDRGPAGSVAPRG